ncbi:MAG TPA: EamA family transporter [Polyangiales bacterium]|nr:EamA family transporter [Polyangiales bacterium]
MPTSDAFSSRARGAAFGLAAAALFGLSAPLAKLLLASVSPVLLAGLLYLGAALGLWLHRACAAPTSEAGLRRGDLPKLALVVIAGGVAGPVLMLFGLRRVSGLAGSLLLNLEAPFTMLLALLVFREHLGRSGLIAAALIVAGAGVLKLEPGALGADTLGVLLLAAACACWALDNNLTQLLSLRDPFAVVRVKTLAAGVANTLLGIGLARGTWPEGLLVVAALALGSLSYGVSVVLDAYALRAVGAAREAAFFATAPFVGALASLVLLGESLRWHDAAAMLVMALGVILLVRERHSHVHAHDSLEHEHLHSHDEHHAHAHGPDAPPGEPHSHRHRHEPLVHDHPHVSDAHHRHRH